MLPLEVINNIMSFMSSPTAELIKHAVEDTMFYFFIEDIHKELIELGEVHAENNVDAAQWLYLYGLDHLCKKQLYSYLAGYIYALEARWPTKERKHNIKQARLIFKHIMFPNLEW